MASQVLSGSSNVSYTNNTGQNVRIVINYMKGILIQGIPVRSQISMSWAGVSVVSNAYVIGRNLAFSQAASSGASISLSSNNAQGYGEIPTSLGLPTEIMLSPGQTFSATNIDAYNIVVIPEAG